MSWSSQAFGYGFGSAVVRAIFGDKHTTSFGPEPVRSMTEAEILADEKRFDAEAKALEAADRR